MSLADLNAKLQAANGVTGNPVTEPGEAVAAAAEPVINYAGNGANSAHLDEEYARQPAVPREFQRAARVDYVAEPIANLQRLLPQSENAELELLSAYMQWPARVGPLCVEMNVTAAYFHIPAHRAVFDTMHFLWCERGQFTFLSVTEELKRSEMLERVGGAAFITGLETHIPTPVNARYSIEILRDKWGLRETIRASEQAISNAYEPQADAASLLEDTRRRIANIQDWSARGSEALKARSLGDYHDTAIDDSKTLLGNRFLCAGGGMLFVGPSGIGKSSASVQQDVMWSLGREAFGIRPARKLRILCIQAENDDDDLGEMVRGVCKGLELDEDEREEMAERVWYITENSRTGAEFLSKVVAPLLEKHRPDILRIDPLLAYAGGDVNEAQTASDFLRHGLNPMLSKYQCAVIVNHHTPKVTNRDTSNWRGSDSMYSGAGSADFTNWARAALVIDPTHTPHVFQFHAAKRGGRIGWVNSAGGIEVSRHFSHAKEGAIFWCDSTPADLQAAIDAKPGKRKKSTSLTKEDLKALVPIKGEIAKKALLSLAQSEGIGVNRANGFLAVLIKDGEVFEWKIPRSKTNPEIRISRREQTLL